MTGADWDEAKVLEGCRRGERAAQQALYEQHAERVYRLLLRLCGNEQDAADVLQETFLRAFDRINTFDGQAGLGTWLYRIATNEAFQLFRRRSREQRHRRELAASRSATVAPPEVAEAGEFEAALARLSEQHRAILVLKYQENLSYEAIAGILDCPPGTVASRLNRARAELRAILEKSPEFAREEDRPEGHPTHEEANGVDEPGGWAIEP